MSDPEKQSEAIETPAAESAPASGGKTAGGGVVERVVLPVAEAAVGGIVTAAVGVVAQKAAKKP